MEFAGKFAGTGYGQVMGIDKTDESHRVFLGVDWGQTLLVLYVGNLAEPVLEQSAELNGYYGTLRVANDTVYLPTGYYGVQVVHLTHL